jgi:hypothetical protein
MTKYTSVLLEAASSRGFGRWPHRGSAGGERLRGEVEGRAAKSKTGLQRLPVEVVGQRS